MNEAEWLVSRDPAAMLTHLRGQASARKFRLFACARCRRVWELLAEARSQAALEMTERHADELGDESVLADASASARTAYQDALDKWVHRLPVHAAALAAWEAASNCASYWGSKGQRQSLAAMVRDVLGNPFRAIALSAASRTPLVVSLATADYEERLHPNGELDPYRLAVLADALEEVGASEEVLTHLRSPGPHVRGCWALDLCLGKS